MKNFYLILLTFCLVLASCQQQENVDPLNAAHQANEVPPEMASTIAGNFNTIFAATTFKRESKNLRLSNKEKTIKEVTAFQDETGKPVYYVISYNEGGFVIVSAEKKTMPILAFSETNIFPVDKEFPDGVKETMGSYEETIRKARINASASDPRIVKEWERLENTDAVNELMIKARSAAKTKSEPVDPPCQDSQLHVTLSTTAWGQVQLGTARCHSNTLLDVLVCQTVVPGRGVWRQRWLLS